MWGKCPYCGETNLRMTLDRIDNNKGHTRANVVPACIRCNVIRKDMPYEAWLVVAPGMREARERGLFGTWMDRSKKRRGSHMASDSKLLRERVKGSATFGFFRDGALWYTANDGWEFPIPVTDTTNAQGASPTFNATEKGITLMRWMRKHMETETQWREQAVTG